MQLEKRSQRRLRRSRFEPEPFARRRFLRYEPLEPRRLLTVDLVSVTPFPAPLTAGADYSSNPDLNANGRYVTFQSHADDLVSGVADTNGTQDVFVRDLLSGVTTLISVNSADTDSGACAGASCGASITSGSFNPAISDDGRFVAFVSEATDLVKGVTIDITPNVFVRDRDADEDGVFDELGAGETSTTLLSIGTDGTAAGVVGGSGASTRPVISGDGAFVVFVSDAPDVRVDDLSIVDTNGSGRDVYRAPVAGGPVTRINVDGTGVGAGFPSGSHVDLSTNGSGSLVAFATSNSGLTTAAAGGVDDTNGGLMDVYVGSGNSPVDLVSVNSAGSGTGDGASREPVLSRNGRHVAFFSAATNLVKGATDTNSFEDLFVRDLKTGRTSLVSRSRAVPGVLVTGDGATPPPGVPPQSEITAGPALSDDGRFVVFRSSAEDLLDPALGVTDTNGVSDIFVLDRDPDRDGLFDEPSETAMILVSVNSAGTASTGHGGLGLGTASSFAPSISRDGRYVAFASTGVDLVPGVSGVNVFVRDLVTGVTSWVSSTVSGGGSGVDPTTAPTRLVDLSADGSRIAFQSETDAADLDPDVTDPPSGSVAFGELDVFAATPPTDIVLGRNFATGLTTHYQAFRVGFEASSPFEIGFYESENRLFDAGDALLGSASITDPDDLVVDGSRVVTSTVGTGAGELTLPGIGSPDTLEDYFILAVGDHLGTVDEFDADPFNEDNTSALRGLYHVPGGPVFVHGWAAGEALTASSDGTTLTFTYGSPSSTFTYDVADVTEVRVRAHEGNDTLTGSDLVDVFLGGEGNDRLDGGAGDDTLNGGPGKDTILGGPGKDLIFDGCGDDLVDVGPDDDVVMSTPCSDDIFIDAGGSDTIDFSLDDLAITLDLDSTAVQTVDSDLNTIRLEGVWENVVGSSFDDLFTLRPLPDPRLVDGGPGNNRLILDAGGHPVVDDGTKFSFPGSGMGDIAYTNFAEIRVIHAAARILDDGDAGYDAPNFGRQELSQGFNGDIEFSEANSGNTATWTYDNLPSGIYQVSATWTEAPDRASSAPFSIRDGNGSGPVVGSARVNQELAPNEFNDQGVPWQNLGVVTIVGDQLTVELTDVGADQGADDAFEFVIADAVRIEPISATVIIDDRDAEFSSAGSRTEGLGAFGGLTSTPVTPVSTSGGAWDCTQGECLGWVPAGRYLVSATWPGFVAGAATDATFTVTSGGESFTRNVNQFLAPNDFSEGGIDWERLGVIDVADGNGFRTELTGSAGLLLADAVRLDPAPRLELFDASGDLIINGGGFEFDKTALDTDTGEAQIRERFTIRNTGSGSLQLADIAVGGTGFSLFDPGVAELPPGGSTGFEVDFTQSQEGEFFGNVTLDVNEFGVSPFTFDLTAEIVADDTPPTVEIVSPDGGAVFVEGTSIQIEGSAFDDIQVKQVELLVNDQVVQSTFEPLFRFPVDSTPFVGNSTIDAVVRVTDLAGNAVDSDPLTVELLPDQPPQVGFVRPLDGDGVLEGSTIRLQLEANDDVGIDQVEIFVDNVPLTVLTQEPLIADGVRIENAGDHEIKACATDTGGTQTCETVTITAFNPPLHGFVGSVVAASDPGLPAIVQVFQPGGDESFRFRAYGNNFQGGVRVATGDVTGDGTPDIITGADTAAGPHVKVFDGATGHQRQSFFAYDGFTGGVNVAVGDVSGDGVLDIITGAGPGAPGGHVRVFSGVDGSLLVNFLAFPGFTGGVFVAAGDVNGDGQDDIITGAGPGAGPHVRVFDGHLAGQIPLDGSLPERALLHSFVAYDPNFTGGVFVAAGDLNNDGRPDIITGAGPGGGPSVKVFSGTSQTELGGFFAYDPAFTGGVRVAAGDVNGDGVADIITGAGAGGGPHVKVFDGTTINATGEIENFFAFDPAFSGGVFVGGSTARTIDVVNLPPTGGTYEALIDDNQLVVRRQGGAELFRGPADDHRKVRINGAANADDLLITTLLGPSKPIVFDGGIGGFDAVHLARRTPSQPIAYLKYELKNVMITSYSTNRNAQPEDFEALTVDLEPIVDELEVMDREFAFGSGGNMIVLNTGDDPEDTILRLDSQNSEVVDFERPVDSLLLGLGPGDDTLSVDLDTLPHIDGQSGTNRLVLEGGGRLIDLTAIADTDFRNIDVIDIRGSGGNQLTVDAEEILNLSEASNELRVLAGSDDIVNFGLGWSVTGTTTVDGMFFRILEQDVPQLGVARLLLNGPRNWQHPIDRHDVNNNGISVEPVGDILRLINEVNNPRFSDAFGRLPDEPDGMNFAFLDVNGDGFVTPTGDILPQVNEANRQSGGGEGERSPLPTTQLVFPGRGPSALTAGAGTRTPLDDRAMPEGRWRAMRDSVAQLHDVARAGAAMPGTLGVAARDRVFAQAGDDGLDPFNPLVDPIADQLTGDVAGRRWFD